MTDIRTSPEQAAEEMVRQRIREDPSVSARPVLLHGGTYQLYQTPAGGLHITFRREYGQDENGAIAQIDNPEWEHAPFEIPAQLIAAAQQAQAEFDRTGKPPSKMQMIKMMMGFGFDGLTDE